MGYFALPPDNATVTDLAKTARQNLKLFIDSRPEEDGPVMEYLLHFAESNIKDIRKKLIAAGKLKGIDENGNPTPQSSHIGIDPGISEDGSWSQES